MEVIKLRAYFMNRYAYWLLASMVISTILIFMTFDISRESRFIYSVCAIGAETYLGLYLNRFEPKFITLQDNEFEISYINFKNFAKADATYNKNEVEVANKGDMLLLIYKNGIIGKVRKKAASVGDWTLLEKYFI